MILRKTAMTIISCFLLFGAIGCAPGIYINKDFEGHDFTGQRLKVVQLDTTKIVYKGSLDNEFGEKNHSQKIGAYICGSTATYLKDSSVLGDVSIGFIDPLIMQKTFLKCQSSKDSFEFSVPKKSDAIDGTDSSDITLFLENTSIESIPYVSFITVGLIPIPVAHKPLYIRAKFAYWSNRLSKPIAWGYGFGYSDFPYAVAITKNTWKYAISIFTRSILKESPFTKK